MFVRLCINHNVKIYEITASTLLMHHSLLDEDMHMWTYETSNEMIVCFGSARKVLGCPQLLPSALVGVLWRVWACVLHVQRTCASITSLAHDLHMPKLIMGRCTCFSFIASMTQSLWQAMCTHACKANVGAGGSWGHRGRGILGVLVVLCIRPCLHLSYDSTRWYLPIQFCATYAAGHDAISIPGLPHSGLRSTIEWMSHQGRRLLTHHRLMCIKLMSIEYHLFHFRCCLGFVQRSRIAIFIRNKRSQIAITDHGCLVHNLCQKQII